MDSLSYMSVPEGYRYIKAAGMLYDDMPDMEDNDTIYDVPPKVKLWDSRTARRLKCGNNNESESNM